MNTSEIGTKLDGAIRQHELMLERVWKYRLSHRIDEVQANSPQRYIQGVLHSFFVEAESRVADIQRMLLLSLPEVVEAKDEDIIKAATNILTHKVQDIYDDMHNRLHDYCRDKPLNVDPSPWLDEINAKRESVSVWSGFDFREKALHWLKDREVLESTLKSAKANAEAAEAERRSADASMLAAKAARTTAVWTRWAVLATAVAALATACSAYYTKLSAEATKTQPTHTSEQKVAQQSTPRPATARTTTSPLSGQVIQQQVPHPPPVSTGKAK